MKNKILFISILIAICCICYAQDDSYNQNSGDYSYSIPAEEQNIANNSKKKEDEYTILEKKIYKILKESNEECLKLLGLSNNQKHKIVKLQQSYMKIAKYHGVQLRNAYRDYNEEYKKNPNSKETEKAKQFLIKAALCTKQDYEKYQSNLFLILNDQQIKIYNEYLERKIKEMKTKWNNSKKK
ncbi:MAG: hypothetical protein KBT47_03060 [Armatimonadetes bacterium]|nr:hypothetical protein [Candidatus Hippobium faecium]